MVEKHDVNVLRPFFFALLTSKIDSFRLQMRIVKKIHGDRETFYCLNLKMAFQSLLVKPFILILQLRMNEKAQFISIKTDQKTILAINFGRKATGRNGKRSKTLQRGEKPSLEKKVFTECFDPSTRNLQIHDTIFLAKKCCSLHRTCLSRNIYVESNRS